MSLNSYNIKIYFMIDVGKLDFFQNKLDLKMFEVGK